MSDEERSVASRMAATFAELAAANSGNVTMRATPIAAAGDENSSGDPGALVYTNAAILDRHSRHICSIVELDPELIDISFVRDRLFDAIDLGYDLLKESISARGQQIAILVRPHPTLEGRYQVACGHRRLRAAKELRRKIRAIVKQMSDLELVVAQGLDNAARQNLSFIERALFAMRLEACGYARRDILGALATDKTELSKMLSVARRMPESIITAIGPAPKAGRPRWNQLAETLQKSSARKAAEELTLDPAFRDKDSDGRFLHILNATGQKAARPVKTEFWKSATDSVAVKINRTGKTISIAFDGADGAEFAEFIAARFDALHDEFASRPKT